MRRLFVCATNTGVGKTHTSLLLLQSLAQHGFKVGAFKPIETGVDKIPADGAKLYELCCRLNSDFSRLYLDDVVPFCFSLPAAPWVAKKEVLIDFKVLQEKLKKIEEVCDIVIIEGAGGLLTPIELDFFMIDLIALFEAKTLLVGHGRLGCINDILLSLEALKNRNIDPLWCINLTSNDTEFFATSLPYLQGRFGEVLLLPQDLGLFVEKILPSS